MKKILIVENDQATASALEGKFIGAGFGTTVVRDGADALHKPMEVRPDVILLNPVVPTMSGADLAETWRHNTATATIPIIAIVKSSSEADMESAHALRPRDVVFTEPLDLDGILKKVEASIAAPALPKKKDARLTGKKIVWTEDDMFLRDLVAAKLSQEGCLSFYAKNGEECLALLQKPEVGVPDAILLDLILPGMSGFDVLARIRENGALKDVPVIIISNLGQKEDLEKTQALGARKHLVKAESDPDELIDAIVEVMK